MKEEIIIDGQICAIILAANFDEPGTDFFTSNDLSQQLASMSHAPGKAIQAHTHNPVRREISYTQEALFIRKGTSNNTRFPAISALAERMVAAPVPR
jgi:hypothetical protein